MTTGRVSGDVIIGNDGQRGWPQAGAGGAAPTLGAGRLWAVMPVATQRPEPFPAGDEVRRLGDEQAAPGRVATLVAGGTTAERGFTTVVEKVSNLLGLVRIELVRCNRATTGGVIAASGQHPPSPAGSTWSLYDPRVMATVVPRSGAARVDDDGTVSGGIARTVRDSASTWPEDCTGGTCRAPRPTGHMNRDWVARSSTGGWQPSRSLAASNVQSGSPGLHLMDATRPQSNFWRTV
jgi:hypothetical protein